MSEKLLYELCESLETIQMIIFLKKKKKKPKTLTNPVRELPLCELRDEPISLILIMA